MRELLIKRRPSHGTVVAYLALFVAMSGTAVAIDGPLAGTNTVGSADIINAEVTNSDLGSDAVGSGKIADLSVKNNDLSTGASSTNTIADDGVRSIDIRNDSLSGGGLAGADIAPDALTDADIDESTLGQVPSAGQVDGLDAALIHHQTTAVTPAPVEVLNLGGLILRLECVNTDLFEPRLVAATTVEDAIIRSRTLPDGGVTEVGRITDDDFDTAPADEKTLYDASQGSGLINYMTPAGSNVTVHYMVDGIGTNVGGCSVSGTAFQGNA